MRFELPLDVLEGYRFGVYISRSFNVVHGPYLPGRACLSLPYGGVNISSGNDVIDFIEFPELPYLIC